MRYIPWIAGLLISLPMTGPLLADEDQAGTTPPVFAAVREHVTQCATRVYYNTFDGMSAGSEWSDHQILRTKKGDRPYLGDFPPGKLVTLSLHSLPAHKLVRLTFDLFLTHSWSGSSTQWAPSLWDLSLDDGRSLIHTSFCGLGFFSNNNEQAFPDTYPSRPHPAWTGAAEKQSLGAIQSWSGPSSRYDASSVYHLVLTFPHAAKDIEFRFESNSPKGSKNKFFGLTNVQVETLPQLETHTEKEFGKLWRDLASPHYPRFYDAQWDLIASGDSAAEYIARHLTESINFNPKQVRGLIDDLRNANGDCTDVGETLAAQGRLAQDVVSGALNDGNLPDKMQECLNDARALIDRFPQTTDETRLARARHVLEVIDMPVEQWKKIVRDEVERETQDSTQLAKLKELFPALFGGS